jgi:hypothetical protein
LLVVVLDRLGFGGFWVADSYQTLAQTIYVRTRDNDLSVINNLNSATTTVDCQQLNPETRPGRLHPGTARLAVERTRACRRLRNWRVGIEARISHLKRSFGLRRTRLRRLGGARTLVRLGVFTYNLQRMTVVGG